MAHIVNIKGRTRQAKVRHPAIVFALVFVTLGIYYLVWYYKVNRELRALGRAAARQLPERAGLVVVAEAGDAAGGVGEAVRHLPDLALVDVGLPGLDGFAAAEQLAALSPAPHVILTSSHDRADFGVLVADSPA